MSDDRLNRDEDCELRRLHFYQEVGLALPDDLAELKQRLRARDQRSSVREPFDEVDEVPLRTVAAVPTGRSVAGLVLAAGSGSRMGLAKALIELDGQLLVDRATAALRSAGCDPVVVVLGAAAGQVQARADLGGAQVVVNEGYADGMASSLRTGLAALSGTEASAVVVSLVDQPRAGSEVVRRLLAVAVERPALAALVAGYDGVGRNPVLLRRQVWGEVAAGATGDAGAREWLRTHPDQVALVECGDLGSGDDLDTPDDLALARARARG